MSDKPKANLSALVDGEDLNGEMAQLIEQLRQDPALQDCWERYHIIRDVVRGDYSPALGPSFASAVSRAIATEPIVLAPGRVSREPRQGRRRWTKPIAGFAIAASLAVVSFLGLKVVQEEPTKRMSVPGASETVPFPAQLREEFSVASIHGTRWHLEDAALEKRLNLYLLSHTEQATMGEIQGMLPYSRLVGYDVGQ